MHQTRVTEFIRRGNIVPTLFRTSKRSEAHCVKRSCLQVQAGGLGKRICRQVEKASLCEVSGEQIRWAKAKAALTTAWTRLG